MTPAILVLNVGSSSVKFKVYAKRGETAQIAGHISGIGGEARIEMSGCGAPEDTAVLSTHNDAIDYVLARIASSQQTLEIVAAGHRIVHGGETYAEPALLTDAVIADLERLRPLAPNHQPHNLSGVRAVKTLWPNLPQVACFDTGFHRTQPPEAQAFALPRAVTERGVMRYGFHGLSYDYIAGALPSALGPRAEGRVIVAHLGHGASMCAMRRRRSIATTMGFTALDGLPMGKRCGALDAGVVLHFLTEFGMSPDEVAHMLYNESGLLGVSGVSDDMRTLLNSDAPAAKDAVELFVYRAAREIGGLAAALGGLDALVFTAGIGEHAAEIRRRICARSAWLGVELDEAANTAHAARISSDASQISVCIIPTDEEWVIARETQRLVD